MRNTYGAVFLCLILLPMMIVFEPLNAASKASGYSDASVNPFDHESDQLLNGHGNIRDLNPFSWMIKCYQKYISPINGNRCPMYPSCSEFAVQAIKTKGERGLPMIFDRLLRCGRDLDLYTLQFTQGRVLRADPVAQGFECKTNESPQ